MSVPQGWAGTQTKQFGPTPRLTDLYSFRKDEDFQRMSVLRGHPPKVIWIRLGNCASADVARLLRFRLEQVRVFVGDGESAFLALG